MVVDFLLPLGALFDHPIPYGRQPHRIPVFAFVFPKPILSESLD
jgi:hypothetical protein